MTKDEYEATYGAVPLRFSSYYKYSFTFSGTAPDGAEISASYGGNSGDIYRHAVDRDSTSPASITAGSWFSVTVTKNGAEVFSHYDY